MYIIILVVICVPFVLFAAHRTIRPMKWCCDIMGWHDGKGEEPHFEDGDSLGVNITSTCSVCGKSVMQDSQGNWF